MQINLDYNRYKYQSTPIKPSFTGARDINLKYIYDNRLRLVPQRMRVQVTSIVEKNGNIFEPLRDLHLRTYGSLLRCRSLGKAQNLFPEFREVLQANAVVKHKSPNIKKIMKKTPLEKFTLKFLKDRWGKLKTLDQIAHEYGLKDRSAITWLMDKIHMPDLGKNYQALLKASDDRLNEQIGQKVRNYNLQHLELTDLRRQVNEETWDRLPELKSRLAETRNWKEFWADPDTRKLWSETRKEVYKDIKETQTRKRG